jgi:pyruvate,water dikinase
MEFVPPGPGAWELERTHLTRPMSGFMAEAFPRAMMKGFRESTEFYGALLDYFEVAVLHRVLYLCPRPVGAPKGAKGPPPRLVFAILRRLHPEIRRRIARAETVFRDRTWRQEVQRWDEEVKPANVREGRALQQEDIAAADAEQLIDHLRRAADFAERTIYWHHRFNACTVVPMGDFLAHATAWTGLGAAALLQVFRGLSPDSAGATEELAALRDAIHGDADARRVLDSSDAPAAILQALKARPAPVAPALTAYLDVVGWRIIGAYDVSEGHALEHPELLVKIIRAAVRGTPQVQRDDAAERLAAIRARVPAEHQATFDALLREAQYTYRVRDERNFYSDALGTGILRRAILEAASRLVRDGRLHDADHLMDASIGEVINLLRGAVVPSSDELAARAHYRHTLSLDDLPQTLGFAPSPPPPDDWLPHAAARLQRAIGIVIGLMFDARKEPQTAPTKLKGNAASGGTHEGVARVVAAPAELSSVLQGEILVTTSTSPTFNVVLPLVSAIVTERGGALSHAAIVAREYGIPAVVGCNGATTAIRTGARLRVDGDTGDVWIIG